jgi:hypothetical protein
VTKRKENSGGDRRIETPPLSRPLALSSVPAEGLDVLLRANEAECAALARLNALPAVLSLEAPLHVTRSGREGLKVVGVVRATVRQTCVVTLEDFDTTLEEPISLRFAPPEPEAGTEQGRRAKPLSAEDALDMDDERPDPLIGGQIDLGALAAEFLTLGLDPHPRKPDAHFEEPTPATPEESPFIVLKQGPRAGGE